jgi:hypothetical protein
MLDSLAVFLVKLGRAGCAAKIKSLKNQPRTIPEFVEFLTDLMEIWAISLSICLSILCHRRGSGILLA